MDFPVLYHAQHKDYTQDQSFWLELASQSNGSILELGCGTGRVLLAIAQAGFPIFGLDNDLHMLLLLQELASETIRASLNIIQADMGRFHLATRFGLILLPCNTYSTFSLSQRQAILGCIQRQMLPGGIFAVSLPNPAVLMNLPTIGKTDIEDIIYHPVNQEPIQISSAWERTQNEFIVDWHYDHLSPDGNVKRLSIRVKHNLIKTEEYVREFENSGFGRIILYGNFDYSSYKPDSPYLIILAHLDYS